MASLSNHKDGRRTIYTSGPGRPKIALGRIPKKQAESILRHVEALEAAQIDDSAPPKATAEWLAVLAPKLRARLEKLGLCERRSSGQNATLGDLLDRYENEDHFRRYEPGTVEGHRVAKASIQKHWGFDRKVASLSRDDAKAFREALVQDGLAEATIRKRCSIASKLLRYAIDEQIIDRNPFDDARVPRSSVASDPENYVEVGYAEAVKIIDQLPTAELKLVFALARFGGLRVGSEVRRISLEDANWDEGLLWVWSRKTKRYGKYGRWIPIHPIVEPLLLSCCERLEPGETLVLKDLQTRSDASLRKPLLAAIKRAGLEPWPELWKCLRKNFQNDVTRAADSIADACRIMGNSPQTAEKHYLRTPPAVVKRVGDALRAQNRVQNVASEGESEGAKVNTPKEKPPVVLGGLSQPHLNTFTEQPRQDSNLE